MDCWIAGNTCKSLSFNVSTSIEMDNTAKLKMYQQLLLSSKSQDSDLSACAEFMATRNFGVVLTGPRAQETESSDVC